MITVIDPAGHTPEVECFNQIVSWGFRAQYHLPGIYGTDSLREIDTTLSSGLIIFGSATSVVDHPDWQADLVTVIKNFAYAKLPILGICYGHQLIAHIYGGKLGFLNESKAKASGFDNVKFTAFSRLWPQQEGSVVVSHREIVTTVPDEFEVIASRDSLSIEALQHNHLPIFSIQSHPEANAAFLRHQGIDDPCRENQFVFGHSLVQKFLQYASISR